MKMPALITVAFWRTQVGTFLAAVTLGSLIVLSRVPLQGNLGPNAPFLLAWPAILFTAFLGGFWPAILVTTLSVVVGQWAITTAGAAPLGAGAIAIHVAFGVVFAVAGDMRKRGLRRARAAADRLAEIQGQMIQVFRLNAMGEMAGSLAHELNQPVNGIANYLNAAETLLGREDISPARVRELGAQAGDQVFGPGRSGPGRAISNARDRFTSHRPRPCCRGVQVAPG